MATHSELTKADQAEAELNQFHHYVNFVGDTAVAFPRVDNQNSS